MRLTGSIGMCPLLWAMLAIACCASAAAQDDPVGVCVDPRGCGPEPTPAPSPTQNNPTPSYDYEAARRAQEALDAAAAAERQRQVEAERIERERVAAEKRRKDAEFIRNRDATVL